MSSIVYLNLSPDVALENYVTIQEPHARANAQLCNELRREYPGTVTYTRLNGLPISFPATLISAIAGR